MFTVNASDLAHAGALVVDTPTGSTSTINVMGASSLPEALPAVQGNSANVGYSVAGVAVTAGMTGAGSGVSSTATALDPVAAFGSTGGTGVGGSSFGPGGGMGGAGGGNGSAGSSGGAKGGAGTASMRANPAKNGGQTAAGSQASTNGLAGSGSKPGSGVQDASGGLVPYAGNPGLLDASVLPESPGLLLLCSGLLALAPLFLRRRIANN